MKPTTTQAREYLNQMPEKYSNIVAQVKGNRFYITFNRPKRYNAFSNDMYDTFAEYIERANELQEVKFIIINGAGGNFSSGNDLNNFLDAKLIGMGTVEQMSKVSSLGLQKLADTVILSRKPMFAITEGLAIGFAFTQLALYDRVFAVDTSSFTAPLVKLAQGPQMCSSYLFPKIFGNKVAEDLIFKGIKVDAKFLQKYQFLQSFASRKLADDALEQHLKDLEKLNWTSYLEARRLFRDPQREILLGVSKKESENLALRWSDPNLPAHLVQYMANNKKQRQLRAKL